MGLVENNELFCSIIVWDLTRSEQTVASLRAYLRDYAVDAYSRVPGLRQKVWISSTGPDGETWGAVYLWDNPAAAYGRPPVTSQVSELIGYLPTSRRYFGVEATTEGVSAVGALVAGLGAAYGPPAAEPYRRPVEYTPEVASIIPVTRAGGESG
ncbi:hypothetical protein [Krasilnikovia sp. MM14-A1259]|uniref:hypothetical protein n=1 Tax=Krasilnikovia sp. MM14-A1259 TaxID=3373539 RepID=UPI003826F6F8